MLLNKSVNRLRVASYVDMICRTTSGLVEEIQNDEGRNVEGHKEKSNLAVDGIHASNAEGNDSGKDHVMEEDKSVVSPGACVDESTSSKETDQTSTHKESNLSGAKKPDSAADVPKKPEPGTARNSDDLTVEAEVPPGFEKDPDDGDPVGESSKPSEVPDDNAPMLNSQEQNSGQPAASNSVGENGPKEGIVSSTAVLWIALFLFDGHSTKFEIVLVNGYYMSCKLLLVLTLVIEVIRWEFKLLS